VFLVRLDTLEISQLLDSSLFARIDNLVSESSREKDSKQKKCESMQTIKYRTVFDRILAEKNLYQINDTVFSNTVPLVCLGSIFNVLPRLLEKNKSQLAKSESEN